MDARSKLQALQEADLGPLSPQAEQAFSALLSVCDQLLTEQDQLRQALALKGKRQRGHGRGGGGRPPANPSDRGGRSAPANRDHSSEIERQGLEEKRGWLKRSKLDKLTIDREVVLKEIPGLPRDAVLVGYEQVVVQDLVLLRCNTRFVRARYRSRLTGKSYLAPLPPGYAGGFGPGIRTLAPSLAYGANISMPLLHSFFRQAGCSISKGQVCRFVTHSLKEFASEAEAAVRAAVESLGWLQADDTRSGVRTEHGCCLRAGERAGQLL